MATMLGVHEKDTGSGDRAAAFPGHCATRDFEPGVLASPVDLVKKIKAECADTWAAGHTAVWSFKPHPAKVADGSWRKPVQDLATWLLKHKDDCPTIIIIWHEPENDVPKFFRNAAAFVQMFNTVYEWLVEIFPGLTIAHAALAYRYRDGGEITDKTAAQWRTKANLHLVDVYSGRTFPLTAILPEHSGFARWFTYVVAGDKRWGAGERGFTATADKSATRAQTIGREFAWLAVQPVKPELYLIWNTAGSEGDKGLILDQAARTAVAEGFRLLIDAGEGAHPSEPLIVSGRCPLCKGEGTFAWAGDT